MDFNIEIKKVDYEQASVLLSMIRLMAEHEGEADEVINTEEKIKETVCRNENVSAYIVYADKTPAAYLIYFYTYSSYLGCMNMYIEDIFIKKEYRKYGLGKKLMKFAAKKAKENGCGRLDWTCISENISAIEFYKHIGGKHLEERMYFRADGKELEKLAE